jgi:hypothetical protein
VAKIQNGVYGQNPTAMPTSRCADITKTPTPIVSTCFCTQRSRISLHLHLSKDAVSTGIGKIAYAYSNFLENSEGTTWKTCAYIEYMHVYIHFRKHDG